MPVQSRVFEANAELVGALGSGEKFDLVYAQQAVEKHQGGNGGLAHADGADGLGLHQGNLQLPAHQLRQGCSRHPARR